MKLSLYQWHRASIGLVAVAFVLVFAGIGNAGVLGWWTMDDANYPDGYFDVPPRTTPDSSGNGNAGTLNGDVNVGLGAGYAGNAAVFGNTNLGAIDVGTNASLKPNGLGYTFATWVNFRDLSPTWQLISADWNPNGTSGSKFFYHFCLQNKLMKLHLGQPNVDAYSEVVADSQLMVADTWMHVAFTVEITNPDPDFATGEVKLYRDGTLVGQAAYDSYSQLPMTTEPIILGARNNQGLYTTRGRLDDTAIWTSALSSADVAALAAGAAAPNTISTATLGGYWTFDDPVPPLPTATVLDSSTNNYHGTMTPNAVDPFHPEGGRFGGAVRLGGPSDYIDVGDIDYDDEITIAAWIKPDALTTGVYQVVAAQANDNNAGEWAWQIFLHGDKARFYVFDVTDDWGGMEITTPVEVTTDWTHLAMTITANSGETLGEVKAYVNGVQVGDTFEYDIESLVESTESIRFGNKGNVSTTMAFKGLMDDIAIFDQALSAQDIALIYANGVEGWLTPPAPIPGDATGNGLVDDEDAKRLAANWGATSLTSGYTWWQMGDFNGDNKVDASDAAILAAHWGMTSTPQTAHEAAGVPEPSLFALLLGGGILMLARRR